MRAHDSHVRTVTVRLARQTWPYFVVALVFVAGRAWFFVAHPVSFNDTSAFKAAAALPLWSRDVWACNRWFTIPLSYAIVPSDQARIIGQLILSVSWTVLGLAVGSCAIFAGSLVSDDIGKRWEDPISDVFRYRLVYDDPGALAWMRRHGLRSTEGDTRGIYVRYLAAHPGKTLAAPFSTKLSAIPRTVPTTAAGALWTANPRAYTLRFRRVLPGPLDTLLYLPAFRYLLAALGAVALALATAAAVGGTFRRSLVVPAVALLTTYPMALVVWHGDASEVDRHALVVSVVLRLFLLLKLIFAVDSAWSADVAFTSGSAGSAIADGTPYDFW